MFGLGKDILALDWDHREVRAMAGHMVAGKLRVARMFRQSLPAEVASDEPSAFGPWLGDVVRRNGCGGMRTIVAMPRDQVVIKNLTIPPTPEAEIAALVRFQMQKELPFNADDAVIDYTIGEHLPSTKAGTPGESDAGGEPAGSQIELLVAATRTEVVDYYREVAEKAGLKLRRIGLRCFCNLETVRICSPSSESDRVLLVNVGPELTEIDIVQGWRLLFSRSASVPLNGDDRDVFLRRLNLEVMRSVQAARATVADLEVDQLVVAAPQELAREITEDLARSLDVGGWLLDPTSKIELPKDRATGAGEFAPVIGLMLGQADRTRSPFDFLHPHQIVDLRSRRKKRIMTGAGVAAGALVLALIGNGVALAANRSDIAVRQGELTKLKAKAKEVQELRNDVSAIKSTTSAGPGWLMEYKRINELWTGDRQLHKDAHLARWEAALAGDDGGWQITLKVLAADQELADSLEKKLRKAYDVEKQKDYEVKLKNLSRTRDGQYQFEVVIDFKPGRGKSARPK